MRVVIVIVALGACASCGSCRDGSDAGASIPPVATVIPSRAIAAPARGGDCPVSPDASVKRAVLGAEAGGCGLTADKSWALLRCPDARIKVTSHASRYTLCEGGSTLAVRIDGDRVELEGSVRSKRGTMDLSLVYPPRKGYWGVVSSGVYGPEWLAPPEDDVIERFGKLRRRIDGLRCAGFGRPQQSIGSLLEEFLQTTKDRHLSCSPRPWVEPPWLCHLVVTSTSDGGESTLILGAQMSKSGAIDEASVTCGGAG